jgi:putative glycosyltransferase
MYHSSSYINEFYKRITKEAKKITDNYEIIFVDDGSPDDSLQKAIGLYKQDKKVKVIELSRNFGHHKAIMTGLRYAKGEFVFLIDIDLEEEPELLGKFWAEIQKDKTVDVVYGVQEKRKGGWFEGWSGNLFYKVFNFFSDIKIPANTITARLMKQKYIKSLIEYNEKEINIFGLFYDNGYNQVSVYVKKGSHSKTTYTFKKKMNLFINSITSFSNKPLIYIFFIGMIITFLSILMIIKIVVDKLIWNIAIEGWASIVVSIWFFGGLIILLLGVIGIYLSKIFIEVKNRPYSIIKNLYGE